MVDVAYRRVADMERPPSDDEALAAKLTLLNDLIMRTFSRRRRALQIEVTDTEVEMPLRGQQGVLNEVRIRAGDAT
jgi:hypothetical protein